MLLCFLTIKNYNSTISEKFVRAIHLSILERGQQTLFVKSQLVNTLGFVPLYCEGSHRQQVNE